MIPLEFKKHMADLAMQGKLNTQDSNDEPASILLELAKKQKEELINAKKIKRNNKESIIYKENEHYYEIGKNGPICIDNELPFNIPNSWVWCCMNQYLDVRDGTHDTPKYVSEGIPLVTSKNLNEDNIDFTTAKFISHEDHKQISQRSKVDNNDILFAMIGTIGNPVIVSKDREFSIKNVGLFKPLISETNMEYVYYYLRFAQDFMRKNASGAVQSFVSLTVLRNYYIPIPPLKEQQRIVNILKKVDTYVNLDQQLLDLNNSFVDKFKKLILQEAMQGKLVPQDPNDEPASILLDNIKKEKEKLIKAKKIKRNNKESVIYKKNGSYFEKIGKKGEPICIDENIPFEIPDSWLWCRLNSYANIVMGQSPKGEYVLDNGEGIEFHQGKIFFGDKFLNKSDKTTIKPSKISPKNSILLCIRAPVGVINICDREICIGRGLASLKPFIEECFNYLYYFLLTQEIIYKSKSTGSTFKAIKKDIVENTLIPIPPLNEQKRIVNKIDKLFETTDILIDKL